MLLNIASAVNEASGYLLRDSNFIFVSEYIFINPETFEPDLIYIPAVMNEGGLPRLAAFISDLTLCHINAEGFDKGNFVQRILVSAKSEVFNNREFIILLNELLYGRERKAGDMEEQVNELYGMHNAQDRKSIQNLSGTKIKQDIKKAGKPCNIKSVKDETDKRDFPFPVLDKKEEKKENYYKTMKIVHKSWWIPVLAVLVQIILGSVIYLCRGLIAGTGDEPLASYVAVAMIVLAVEVFMFKKLNDARIKNCGIEPTVSRMEPVMERSADKDRPAALEYEQQYPGSSADEEEPAPAVPSTEEPVRVACETELLGSYAGGMRILKSTGSHSGDEDIYINKDDFIIGRLSGYVDHVLMNNAVGKLHAQVICRNGACYIRDLNSVNGTFINNKRIESNKDMELKNNDKLQLANSEFIFMNG